MAISFSLFISMVCSFYLLAISNANAQKTIFGLTEADEIKSSKILDLAQKGSNVLSTDLSWATQISELVQKQSDKLDS